jgi:HTH-type transcriptional regulator / antitoxin MqsA
MTNPICPETGAPMHRGNRLTTIRYREQSTSFEMPGWYCDQSMQSSHTSQDLKVSDRMLHRLKARAHGLLEPEAIRRIRLKLGLSQQAAGELIGGGPRAFQKYETGDLLPSRAICSALILLHRDPEALSALQATAVDHVSEVLEESVDAPQTFQGVTGEG